jgi:MarR family transcriptional regulator, organic hydroperoxide resistance regulator
MSNPPQPTQPPMSVAQLLFQICRLSGRHFRAQMESVGLHRGQGFLLLHLLHNNGIPQRDLAQAMNIRPASISCMLQRMEKEGWVKRMRDPDDQRVVRVFASEKGLTLRSQARRQFQEMEAEINALYNDAERATLEQMMSRLVAHFSDGDPSPHPLLRLFEESTEDAS